MANVALPDRSNWIVVPDSELQGFLARGYISEEQRAAENAALAAQKYQEWLADPETEAKRFEMLRGERDRRIAATDYLMAADYPISEERRAQVMVYRQALRDLPAQEGAPWDGGGHLTPWPEMPVITKSTSNN